MPLNIDFYGGGQTQAPVYKPGNFQNPATANAPHPPTTTQQYARKRGQQRFFGGGIGGPTGGGGGMPGGGTARGGGGGLSRGESTIPSYLLNRG